MSMVHYFFTVDRRQQLKQEGQLIELAQHNDISCRFNSIDLLYGDDPEQEFQNHLDSLFPLGVSDHGDTYFLNRNLFYNASLMTNG